MTNIREVTVSAQDLATLLDATRHVETTPGEDAARLRLEQALHAEI